MITFDHNSSVGTEDTWWGKMSAAPQRPQALRECRSRADDRPKAAECSESVKASSVAGFPEGKRLESGAVTGEPRYHRASRIRFWGRGAMTRLVTVCFLLLAIGGTPAAASSIDGWYVVADLWKGEGGTLYAGPSRTQSECENNAPSLSDVVGCRYLSIYPNDGQWWIFRSSKETILIQGPFNSAQSCDESNDRSRAKCLHVRIDEE